MAASLVPGDVVLGKYRVERVIGKGGMGMVVAARHTALGELFAIKLMLNAGGDTGKQAYDRFLREARICASLKGEHVVKVQDVGELEDGRPYMVMEYLEGQDLGSVIKKQGTLSVSNAAAVVLQACEALAEAHSLGIIHRDIKPPNMFLIRTPSGKLRLKLLDFGISKRVNAETKALTATGAMMGSPLYMSPEQLTDPRAVGPQTDIWAMGVVLYELLTGKVPFDGEMIFQVIQEILNKTPQLPSEHRQSLPFEVDKIIERALRKDPAQRYASIQEFARDVRQLLQANSVIGSSLDLLTKPSEPEVHLDIDARTYDATGFGPTIEASAENLATGPIDVVVVPNQTNRSTNGGAVGAGSLRVATTNRPANTQSDLTKSVPEIGASKALSPIMLGIGAVVLLALGGGAVYLIQAGSRGATSETISTSAGRASNNTIVPVPPTAPQVTADAVPAVAVSAAPSGEPSSNAASTTAAPSTSLGKGKPWPSAKSAASAAPTSTTKREGLF